MIASYGELLLLASTLFMMGLICVATRRTLIMILIGVEIMINASGIAFAAAALRWHSLDGQAYVLFLLAVAAAASVLYLLNNPDDGIAGDTESGPIDDGTA